MKRFIALILVLISVLALAGCGDKNASTFKATIMEINGDSMIVCPDEGSWERSSSDKISVPIIKTKGNVELEEGFRVEIAYNGEIMETYPAQIGKPKWIAVIIE